MFIIDKNCEIEIVEKKSKFITRIFRVHSEDEIKCILKEIAVNEKGASHNCYAYRLLKNDVIVERKNDDGEPGGTAGAPMLSILSGEDLVNVLAVTTRYFGGIKLGTGGLSNVYKRGVKEALKNVCKELFEQENLYSLIMQINQVDKVEYNLKKENIKIIGKEFGDQVTFKVLLTKNKLDRLKIISENYHLKYYKE
jgi:uncharacterized YigZ family protein